MDTATPDRVILILDAHPDHGRWIHEGLQATDNPYRLVTIADGHDAIAFLYRRGKFTEVPRPDLILLDLNLPGIDGREILSQLKRDPQLRRIPVIVLTLSDSLDDVVQTYQIQGNCYVIKSCDRDSLLQTIQRIEEFWLGIVTLPVQ